MALPGYFAGDFVTRARTRRDHHRPGYGTHGVALYNRIPVDLKLLQAWHLSDIAACCTAMYDPSCEEADYLSPENGCDAGDTPHITLKGEAIYTNVFNSLSKIA